MIGMAGSVFAAGLFPLLQSGLLKVAGDGAFQQLAGNTGA